MKIHLNLEQSFEVNTSTLFVRLETVKNDSFKGKQIQTIGEARLRFPNQSLQIVNDDTNHYYSLRVSFLQQARANHTFLLFSPLWNRWLLLDIRRHRKRIVLEQSLWLYSILEEKEFLWRQAKNNRLKSLFLVIRRSVFHRCLFTMLLIFDRSTIIKLNWKRSLQLTSNFIHWTSISLIFSFITSILRFDTLTDGRSSLLTIPQKIISIDTFSIMNKQPTTSRWSLDFENWIPRKSLDSLRVKLFPRSRSPSFSLRTTNFVSTRRRVSISTKAINNGNPMEWEWDPRRIFSTRI